MFGVRETERERQKDRERQRKIKRERDTEVYIFIKMKALLTEEDLSQFLLTCYQVMGRIPEQLLQLAPICFHMNNISLITNKNCLSMASPY